jgi:hypothetical protein
MDMSHKIELFDLVLWCLTIFQLYRGGHLYTWFYMLQYFWPYTINTLILEGRCGRDRMEVGNTTTYAVGAYHH